MNYYYKNHGIKDFFHDYVFIHVHEFGTILHSVTSRNGSDSVGRDWWFLIKSSLFCSATRRHDINSEYFVNLHSRYCCCRSTFEAWSVVKVFFNMSSSVIFSPHNFNWELILKSAELYSLTVLKSCNLRCIQSYRAFGRITVFWWSYISFKLLYRVKWSFTVRYSFFKPSWRWWRRKINAFARSCRDAWFPCLIVAPRFIASRCNSV